jgi:elongation factor 1-beta
VFDIFTPSQADIAVHNALKSSPDAAKFPHIARWYRHIGSFKAEASQLRGDPTKPYTAYGPSAAEVEDDDEIDLFGSEDEEEDAEAVRIREERLAGEIFLGYLLQTSQDDRTNGISRLQQEEGRKD